MLGLLFFAIIIASGVAQSGHPEFDPPMEQVILEEGSWASVECVAKGELPLTYTWYNQRDAVIPSDTNQELYVQRSENGSFLTFAAVKRSEAGLYSCSATNKHGTASKPYDILVNTSSGHITKNETAEIHNVKVVNITESSVEFFVSTTGNPDSFYIRYQEKLDREEKWVQIKNGEKAVVKNLVSSGRYEFRFQIEPPFRVKSPSTPYYVTLLPGVPDVIFRNIRDGSVDVEWFRSIDDLSRGTIEEYQLSYNIVRLVQGKTWGPSDCVITVKIPLRDCSAARHTLAGLQKETYYEIRLRVSTKAGFGKPYANKVYIL